MNASPCKPLVRWTIGPVTSIGYEILLESISRFSILYPEFKKILCFNHIDKLILKKLTDSCDFYQSSADDVPCLLCLPDKNIEEATGCGWKLAPPRLNPQGLELFIDNDLIIRKRLPQIDLWLKNGDYGLIAEGLNRKRMYGIFDSFVPPNIHANAGLFGLPPGFDFGKQIADYANYLNGGLGGYNEQGLTVATVVNMPKYIMVPLSKLHISEDHSEFPQKIPDAIHFVGANRKEWHRGWAHYKKITRSILMT
jgi:hypothetical protein